MANVRRWLKNPHLEPQTLYEPSISHVLKRWANRDLTMMLDGCVVYGDRLQMVRLSLSHGYRAVPLARKVVAAKGVVALDVCEPLLEYVAQLLERTRRVTFLADRGFRDRDCAHTCRELHWNYIIRIANTTPITFADGRTTTAEQVRSKPGQRRYLPRVRRTLAADWACNLAITWTRATATCPAAVCVVVTNVHADGWVLRHYLKRIHIEQSFRDEKSGGFDRDSSR